MQTELLRSLLLDYLRTTYQQAGLQYANCVSGVVNLATKRCPDELDRLSEAQYQLKEADAARLTHVIWDLILGRVLVPGTRTPNTGRDGWPNLSVTDHGRVVLSGSMPVPYDPDGYLADLDKAVGGLNLSVKRYLEESLCTFRTGHHLLAVVMLGAASEMVFLEVCKAIATAVVPGDRLKFEQRTGPRKKMVDRIAAVTSWLNQKKAQLPAEWQRQEQVGSVDKIADFIRNRRNDAGHPHDPTEVPTHEQVYGMLVVFPEYCRKLYELKLWLSDHPGIIR